MTAPIAKPSDKPKDYQEYDCGLGIRHDVLIRPNAWGVYTTDNKQLLAIPTQYKKNARIFSFESFPFSRPQAEEFVKLVCERTNWQSSPHHNSVFQYEGQSPISRAIILWDCYQRMKEFSEDAAIINDAAITDAEFIKRAFADKREDEVYDGDTAAD